MLRLHLIAAVLFVGCLAFGQNTQRLILKDGSYQSVQKYEIRGNNVHYLSAERYEWEDIPSAMIDWEATEKYQKDVAKKATEAKEANEEETKSSDSPNADAGLPAGLALPAKSGVFVLSETNSKPEFIELSQNETHPVEHDTAFLLTKKVNPMATRKETLELTGAHAKPQTGSKHPVIFIKPELQSEDEQQPRKKPLDQRLTSGDAFRFELLKLDVVKNSRVLITTKTNQADYATQSLQSVPVFAQVVAGDLWIKIEPKQDLAPGEYAVVQTVEESRIGGYVWDFGVQGAIAPNVGTKKKKKP